MIPNTVAEGQPIPSGVRVERWEPTKIGATRTCGGEVSKAEYVGKSLSPKNGVK
jgi:hypothetical protein